MTMANHNDTTNDSDEQSFEFTPLGDNPDPPTCDTDPEGRGPPCGACGRRIKTQDFTTVTLGEDSYDVCDRCLNVLVSNVERPYWYDRLTEDHYDRAVEYLHTLDEVWCVKDHAYPGGELWVHTPYCDAGVVNDVCEHFGFRIRWFSIVEPTDHEFDCVHNHGPCVEINLDYPGRVTEPMPLEYDIEENRSYSDVEYVGDETRLFDDDQG